MQTKHHWRAQIQRQDGEIIERDLYAYWDPSKEWVPDLVARTAAAELAAETKKGHAGLTAVLMEDDNVPVVEAAWA